MARLVSLTLFLLSWLLLFSYAASDNANNLECQVCTKVVDHIHQQVQNNEAQICPKKVPYMSQKGSDIVEKKGTDVDDFICKIQPQIDELARNVCYDLYPDACPGTPSTKDRNEREKLSEDDEIVHLKEENHGRIHQVSLWLKDRMSFRREGQKDPNSKKRKFEN